MAITVGLDHFSTAGDIVYRIVFRDFVKLRHFGNTGGHQKYYFFSPSLAIIEDPG